jgi:hypothetical protein
VRDFGAFTSKSGTQASFLDEKEEGRRKKEEGRRKKEDTIKLMVWAIHNVLSVEVAILRFCLN